MQKFTQGRRFCLAISIGLCVIAGTSNAQLANNPNSLYLQIPNPNQAYPFVSSEIDLPEALSLFGKNLRIGVEINDGVEGRILEGWTAPETRLDYLEALALEFDFVWYFDGRTLRVSRVGAMVTEIFPLKNTDGLSLVRILKELDIYQEKFTHRSDLRNQTFLVSGPVDYVDLVKKAFAAIEDAEERPITIVRGTVSDIATPSQAVGVTTPGSDSQSE